MGGWLALVLMGLGADPEPGPINDKVVEFARSVRGESVGNGECTALASAALRHAGAIRTGPTDAPWGVPLESARAARPGDILQFDDVVLVRRQRLPGGALRTLTARFPHHTAIVSAVSGRGSSLALTILHQNVQDVGDDPDRRKVVQEWVIRPAELRSGRVRAFRPTAAAAPADDPAGDGELGDPSGSGAKSQQHACGWPLPDVAPMDGTGTGA